MIYEARAVPGVQIVECEMDPDGVRSRARRSQTSPFSCSHIKSHKLNALYADFSDYYLGVKNSNKGTSEFLTFISLNLWCVLSIFGLFRAFLPSITSNFPMYFNCYFRPLN